MNDRPSGSSWLTKILSGLTRPLYAFLAITAAALCVGYLFDHAAACARGHWPAIVTLPSGYFTSYGKSGWILVGSAALLAIGTVIRRKAISGDGAALGRLMVAGSAYIFASVALSGLAANFLKRLFGRARPQEFNDFGLMHIRPFSFHAVFESFPSGHATTAGALALGLALMFPRYRAWFIAAGLLLASTRVFVGAHYPADVTAGFLFGMWFSLVTAIFFARRGALFALNASGLPEIAK